MLFGCVVWFGLVCVFVCLFFLFGWLVGWLVDSRIRKEKWENTQEKMEGSVVVVYIF